jgi:hypothetical protein
MKCWMVKVSSEVQEAQIGATPTAPVNVTRLWLAVPEKDAMAVSTGCDPGSGRQDDVAGTTDRFRTNEYRHLLPGAVMAMARSDASVRDLVPDDLNNG